jgi:hypothetical protein
MARSNVRKTRTGLKKDGLDAGLKLSVGLRNGFFKLKVSGIAKSANDELGSDGLCVVHGKPLVASDPNLRQVGKSSFDPGHALLGTEHVFFVGIYSDTYHHAVKQGG